MKRLRQRFSAPGGEAGSTLLELLVVAVVIALLASAGLASYTGLRSRAQEAAARVAVREALPAVESYFADHSTYVGMSLAALQAYDAGLDATLAFSGLSATSYCVSALAGSRTAHLVGPDNPQPQDGSCPGEAPRA